MADDGDIADRLRGWEEEDKTKFQEQPIAVAWFRRGKNGKREPIARMLPDPTTLHRAKVGYLEVEMGLDLAEDPWALAYRKDDQVVATGYPELKAKVIEVFTANEHLVSS